LVIQKVKSEGSKEITLDIKDALDIIEKVTGVHPYVLDNKSKIRQLTDSIENNNSVLSVNLDAEKINLSEYGNSALLKDYLKKVDNVLSDSTTNNSQKSLQINNLQNEIGQNSEVSIVDIEQFYKVTEILKGSMTLWTNEYPINKVKYNSTNKYLIKEPCKWKNWQKILFISVADAIGGVVCTGSGSMMIINGVPVYVPPGPAGTIIGAAAISFIVSRICYP
jgi:hypothetical protein